MVQIINEGSGSDPTRLLLATKKGSPIPNSRRKPQAPQVMAAAVQMHLNGHPSRRLRSESSDYNCLGMVLASRRTWILVDDPSWILDEDGYQVVSESLVQPGDILLYRDALDEFAHIGVVHTHEPRVEDATWRTIVLSQWGADGEYFHDAADVVELLGKPYGFRTDRVKY